MVISGAVNLSMISFLDIIFPKFCVACRKIGRTFCENCIAKIPVIDHSTYGVQTQNAIPIQKNDMAVDGIYTIVLYQGMGKSMVKQVKYGRAYIILNDFFTILPSKHLSDLSRFIEYNNIQYLQPIPLHMTRERERGFNQSLHIAKHVSFHSQVPLINVLKRVRYTYPQAQIPEKSKRIDNIRNAFEYTDVNKLQNTNIALVDDLYTSGSTCREAARVLKMYGARRVFVCALARG